MSNAIALKVPFHRRCPAEDGWKRPARRPIGRPEAAAGDRAYDSKENRRWCWQKNIESMIPASTDEALAERVMVAGLSGWGHGTALRPSERPRAVAQALARSLLRRAGFWRGFPTGSGVQKPAPHSYAGGFGTPPPDIPLHAFSWSVCGVLTRGFRCEDLPGGKYPCSQACAGSSGGATPVHHSPGNSSGRPPGKGASGGRMNATVSVRA